MTEQPSNSLARMLRSYHDDPAQPLVLPNAWDAGSAVVIAEAGARAIATTSGGAAWSLGRPDGQRLSRDEMIEVVRRVVAAVAVPVTADVEAGYGPAPEDVAATVVAATGAGAAGINLEDSQAPGGPLFPVGLQVERIRAAREAAVRSGVPDLVINARTDVFLFGIGAPEGRLDEVRVRAEAYAGAGADCLFVPGLVELASLRALVAGCPLPVAVMSGPGAPSVAEFGAAGVRRVSVGTGIAQAAYTVARQAAAELLEEGTYRALSGAIEFPAMNQLFQP